MKALVYHGPGQKSWDTVSDPAPAEPTDIVVQIDTTTICGTDLHILKGDVPAVTDGRILGHEAVGTVTAVGSAVSTLAEGDRVLVPAITSCGRCAYCKRAMPSHCQATAGVGLRQRSSYRYGVSTMPARCLGLRGVMPGMSAAREGAQVAGGCPGGLPPDYTFRCWRSMTRRSSSS